MPTTGMKERNPHRRAKIKLIMGSEFDIGELASVTKKPFFRAGINRAKGLLFVILVLRSTLISSEVLQATEITDVGWNSNIKVIEIRLDTFPSTWGNWTMYLDGEAVPMEGGAGNPVVRPNAPLGAPPTGLFVGTEPWITGLTNVNFPCCGTIQFNIPGEGLTNAYEFNVSDLGCETASTKECPQEWISHYGDLVIAGTEIRIMENVKYFQQGNIYIRDEAKLVLKDAHLMMGRGAVSTVHIYIFVDPDASLELESSLVFPEPAGGLVCTLNRGKVNITDSPTSIHYFDMSEGAQLTMVNSEMVFTLGGLLQVTGGTTLLVNSTIGALGLKVPANAHLDVSGLESGVYFESWNVHDMIPEADYDLILENTHILKDDFVGELKHGPYERGWLFFLDPNAHARIVDSEVRKVFIDLVNENVQFENLRVGMPSSLDYRDIKLTDITVMGQWPFTITDSDVTIRDSDYLFLQPTGQSTVTLIDSHICEFIPRDFFGTMVFENGTWTVAGEIIGGVPHHAMTNDFTIKGSLKMGQELRESLQWKGAQVTREYDVIVEDGNRSPVEGALIRIDGKTSATNASGAAKFSLVFDELNYVETKNLEVLEGEIVIGQEEIDFFTETPIRVDIGPTGDFCGPNFGPPDGYVDVWDLMQFADHWHTRTGDGNWDAKSDLTGLNFGDVDGYIDVWDLMVFADHWHEGEAP